MPGSLLLLQDIGLFSLQTQVQDRSAQLNDNAMHRFDEYMMRPNGEILGHSTHNAGKLTLEWVIAFRELFDSPPQRKPVPIHPLLPEYACLRMPLRPTPLGSRIAALFWRGQMVSICAMMMQRDDLAIQLFLEMGASFEPSADVTLYFDRWPVLLSLRVPNPLTVNVDHVELSHLQACMSAAHFSAAKK